MLPIVDEEVAKTRKEPLTAAEMEKAKNELESTFLFRIMSVGGFGGRADLLNMYGYYAGDPGFLEKDMERYR